MNKNFDYLFSTFKSSIKTYDYFVNWSKVFRNRSEFEITLNKLNYLLGKDDLRKEFINLCIAEPDIVRALPILLAVRDSKLEIYDKTSRESEFYDFLIANKTPEEYYIFLEKSGLTSLFKTDGVKNLVDYTMGVEVGLDSNGRKNRGGALMEEIVEIFVSDFCKENNYEYIAQATPKKIEKMWNVNIRMNKSQRSFDFAICNPVTNKIKLIEVNFYNGGGSKLKSVCGEFRNLYDELNIQNVDFIWITDGLGWHSAKRPLEDTFNHNKYLFNLTMLEEGALNSLKW